MTGHIFAHLTATVLRADSEDGETEDGWIDPSWSMHVLHESRNDVRPVVSCSEDDPDLADYVREALDDLGAYEDNGDGTFYGIDAPLTRETLETGDTWLYALHFTRKAWSSARGWHEDAWHPADANII